ncbi:cytosolic sulfotransferase 15-like [Iris pallida]|uniref:Sulfotransferase n=1 Tax=Iris pallida TaxID=29817 RepID=A0AAX6ECF3_IRIPA|nr:cytosolic sulfotransferase 15-like [Iris pallida]KAJ6801787.1 cytosolic sulfotransferase 15-like [Iris pallida]KAJ6806672.1 cytosolic sulfotransferase 15-like [Iris pallida]
MEQSHRPPLRTEQEHEEEVHQRVYQQCRDLVSSLPVVEGCSFPELCFHDGFFRPMPHMVAAMMVRKLFEARPTDIILATLPKSGTTWLKALLFATVNRNSSPSPTGNLATLNPHQCVPFLEVELYGDGARVPDMDSIASPRLLATHIPFHFLPNSVVDSGCRVVYLCRNPKDNFVSFWHFINKVRKNNGGEPLPLEVGFDHFCQGRSPGGPFWDHMLGYWKASLQVGGCNVLFMRYEELMKDPTAELKRLAEFVGCPFTQEEQANGVLEDIVETCGFEKLSSLEVNKVGKQTFLRVKVDNDSFFRRGVVGDWMNHLTPDMAQRIDKIIESKFEGSGLAP